MKTVRKFKINFYLNNKLLKFVRREFRSAMDHAVFVCRKKAVKLCTDNGQLSLQSV